METTGLGRILHRERLVLELIAELYDKMIVIAMASSVYIEHYELLVQHVLSNPSAWTKRLGIYHLV